ncbi:MAG: HEAT repeat domain-containing protein, partial [Parachlamydiaceae bacterium]|nr:HEAT repeat domain-containing protein [Parachlamydiaceae bacterium]
LKAVCDLAKSNGFPFLVIIDAVNENRDLNMVRAALIQLLTAYRRESLFLILTCRDNSWQYLNDLMYNQFYLEVYPFQKKRAMGLSGFEEGVLQLGHYNESEFREARQLYFARSNLQVLLNTDAEKMLHLPLLLRIFSDVHRDTKLAYTKSLVSADLWSAYQKQKTSEVYAAINQSLRQSVIVRTIEQIAELMFERNTPILDLADLQSIPNLNPDSDSDDSLLVQLKNASIFLEDPPETIRFVHEPFAEFILGRILAKRIDQASSRDAALENVAALVHGTRWNYVLIHIASQTTHPEYFLNRLRNENLWWAAKALIAIGEKAPSDVHSQIINDLITQLNSRYTLDKQRAVDSLGRIRASDAMPLIRDFWISTRDRVALRSLALLGDTSIAKEFVLYIGHDARFLWPEQEGLVGLLQPSFKRGAIEEAYKMLNNPTTASEAATALGYLQDIEAVGPLHNYLVEVNYDDASALIALLRIGTSEALAELESAMVELGQQLERNNNDESQESASSLNGGHPKAFWTLEELRVYGFQYSSLDRVSPILTTLLNNPNFYIRYEAINALQMLGAVNTAPLLIQSSSLATNEFSTSSAINQALDSFGSRLDIQPLLDMAHDTDTPDTVMPFVIHALGASRNKKAYPILSQFIQESRFLVETIHALGNLGQREALDVLIPLLQRATFPGHSTENIHHSVVTALGKIQHPSAFEALSRQYNHSGVFFDLESLVAVGRELAIPTLRTAWEEHQTDRFYQEHIIQMLLWINTPAAKNALFELLEPLDSQKAIALVQAISRGRGLLAITGVVFEGVIDDDFVDMIDERLDQFSPDDQSTTVWALRSSDTLRVTNLLTRIASESSFEVDIPGTTGENARTIKQEALRILAERGSLVALDFVLDSIGNPNAIFFERSLAKMERPAVLEGLCNRLPTSEEKKLVRILELLGWLGNQSVLKKIRDFLTDSRLSIANAAYEAEQRILNIAD